MDHTPQSYSTVRAWDLRPGDVFRGRTIVDVRGVVGLAGHPVAVIVFSAGRDHPVQVRVPAAGREATQHCDEIMREAKAWVRAHGLQEGEAVDLDQLRWETSGELCSA